MPALEDDEPPAIDASRFADVDDDDWQAPYIERFAELEITVGCRQEPLRYCPDGSVTRAQMAVFLTRAFNLDPGPDPGFSDVAPDAWYYAQVAALAASGITAGCGEGTFCPTQQTTRAQMATFLTRALDLVETPSDGTYTAISVGGSVSDDYACAIRDDQTVACWGSDGPVQAGVPDGRFTAVSANVYHSCGLRVDQTIACWGGGRPRRAARCA